MRGVSCRFRTLRRLAGRSDPKGTVYVLLAVRLLPTEMVDGLSGYSARVGAAQDMLAEGKTLIQILHRGGWRKPETVYRYIEHAEQL